MKTTNGKIYAARIALAKIANTDAPLPLVHQIAPLLDACDPVIEEYRRLDDQIDSGSGQEQAALEAYSAEEHELPDITIPMYPGFAMNYLEYRALRGIAEIGEV